MSKAMRFAGAFSAIAYAALGASNAVAGSVASQSWPPMAGYATKDTCDRDYVPPKIVSDWQPTGLGVARIEVGVGASGEPQKVVLVEGSMESGYVRSVMRAAKVFSFEPGRCAGKAVPAVYHVRFESRPAAPNP